MSQDVQASSLLRLVLTVDREGGGGVTGLAPTVAIRNPLVTNSYLDWADGLFKTAGWTTRTAVMAEVSASLSPGEYQRDLNLATVPLAVAGFEFFAHFAASNGADINRRTHEEFIVRESVEQLDWVYAVHHNRTEGAPGAPGLLTVYRGDGTLWQTAELRDYVGAAVGGTSGIPARRTKFT
jgi:hypothetical protein